MRFYKKGDKKLLNAWAVYDWANSVYPLVISTAIFPILNMAVTGEAKSITLIITNGGQYTQVGLVANGVWAGGSQPTLSTNGIDIVSIMNVWDGTAYGTNYCFHNGTGME